MFKNFYRTIGYFIIITSIMLIAGCENKIGTQRGVVSGIVIDTNGFVVPGAVVTSHRSLFVAETNQNGYYEFTSLDEGTHRLSAQREGYLTASKTVELAYGRVLGDVRIVLEPAPDLLKWQIVDRTSETLHLYVESVEEVSLWASYREINTARIQTEPTKMGHNHHIYLKNLWPGASYSFYIEALTSDNRRFISEEGTFIAVPKGTLPTETEAPINLKVSQTKNGALLTWDYEGVEILSGFRVFRSLINQDLEMIKDEFYVFSNQRSFTDETVIPGKLYQYAIRSVDLDSKPSDLSEKVMFFPSGEILTDQTWYRDWSPINLRGDIIVAPNATLTIEEGVTVRFAANDNEFEPQGRLVVKGRLLAEGKSENPINFIPDSIYNTKSSWGGIALEADTSEPPSKLRHVNITGATKGLVIKQSNLSLEKIMIIKSQNAIIIDNTKAVKLATIGIEESDTALQLINSTNTEITDLRVVNADYAVVSTGNKDFSLTRFDIRKIRSAALRIADFEKSVFRNGIIQSDGTGILSGGYDADYMYLTIDAKNGIVVDSLFVPIIKNCIIVNMRYPLQGFGIEEKITGRAYPYNNIFNFSAALLNASQSGAPIQNEDPKFVGGDYNSYDYRLKADSNLLKSSDRKDQLGAYGGAGL